MTRVAFNVEVGSLLSVTFPEAELDSQFDVVLEEDETHECQCHGEK